MSVSIIRVGLSETDKFSEGWDAIFGKKSANKEKSAPKKAKSSAAKKRKGGAAKKKSKKK
jgi:hypothetical protein